jgi:3-oxoacyl-[acyl-carrier protein] reductase
MSQDPFRLDGLTALVCGASRGIGRATAESFAARGARLVLLARDAVRLAALASALPTVEGGAHRTVAADLAQPDELENILRDVLASIGPIHILVNNSGGPAASPLLEAGDGAFTAALTQHVLSAQSLVKVIVPGMRDAGYGRVVNIVSTSVRAPIPGLGVSNTIRAAMAGWAKTLAGELGPLGITVNNVLPGYTTTERFRELVAAAAHRGGKSEADVEAAWRAAVPLGRFATPEEVASAVCYFASPAASYVTGQSLAVDGGRIASI